MIFQLAINHYQSKLGNWKASGIDPVQSKHEGLIDTMQATTEHFTETEIKKLSPTLGQITAYHDENIPDGWLPCDGRMLRRRIYPELFKIIGTQYGDGDGSNTAFNLPTHTRLESGIRHIIFVGTA